jgi:membrane-associated phospholipid phosphatase
VAAALLGGLAAPPRLAAQERDYTSLRWWHPLAAAGGVAALFLVDEPIRDFVQDHRSGILDDVGSVAAKFHEPEVFLVGSVGAMSLGLVARQPKLAQTGVQILSAYGLASGMMIGAKWAAGRSRPSDTPDNNLAMDWFGGGQRASFPSGASTVVFSLAATVSDAVGDTRVTVLLYSAATLNAWSRVNSDRHWVSDVALGALFGVTAAKLVNGRWRVFGFRPPTVGIAPGGRLVVGYSVGGGRPGR